MNEEANPNQTANATELPSETAQDARPKGLQWHFSGPPVRLLFLCRNNSARSQMAEALTRHLTYGQVEVYSAGSHPAEEVHPAAINAIARLGADMSRHVPKSLDQFQGQQFDRVIILCGRNETDGPTFSGSSKVVTWDFADPIASIGTQEERVGMFQGQAAELMLRIRIALTLIERERREQETKIQ